jgi:hypothetical protein
MYLTDINQSLVYFSYTKFYPYLLIVLKIMTCGYIGETSVLCDHTAHFALTIYKVSLKWFVNQYGWLQVPLVALHIYCNIYLHFSHPTCSVSMMKWVSILHQKLLQITSGLCNNTQKDKTSIILAFMIEIRLWNTHVCCVKIISKP